MDSDRDEARQYLADQGITPDVVAKLKDTRDPKLRELAERIEAIYWQIMGDAPGLSQPKPPK